MWEERGRAGQATDESMKHECWITKAKNTHSEYVIIIVFPRENVFAKGPQRYAYTSIACLVL